jgi:hypothetical protein
MDEIVTTPETDTSHSGDSNNSIDSELAHEVNLNHLPQLLSVNMQKGGR